MDFVDWWFEVDLWIIAVVVAVHIAVVGQIVVVVMVAHIAVVGQIVTAVMADHIAVV